MVEDKDKTDVSKTENVDLVARFKALNEVDITEEFFRLAKELNQGEIVMHPSYSLCVAVSAIELMDPKMDSGMEKPDTSLGLQNTLKNGKLKQKLSVTELLATVDCTFAAIASWLHDAQALDQTVFTNVWLHDVSQIVDPVHRALSKAALLFVQLLRSVVNMAACHSEEDFVASLSFEQQSVKFDEVSKLLDTAEEAVISRVKAKQNKQENTALLNRVRFYQQILVVFDSLVPVNEQRQSAGVDKKWQPQMGAGKAALKSSLNQMQNARDSVKLGRQPQDGSDGNYSWLNCFQPNVNQHSLPPTFPREIKYMTRAGGYEYLISIFQCILNMVEEMPEPNNIISLDTLMDFLERYSYAGIITRSINQLILLPVDDCLFAVRPMVDLVTSSISEFAPSIQQDKLQQYIASRSEDLAADYDEFLMDAVRAFLNIIQLFGHNRTSFHDKYLPELIDIFSMLRTKAISLETNLRGVLISTDIRQCFSTFSDFYATRLAILYMDMGFQLELFVDYELPYVFWCYSDVLYRRIVDYCKSRSQMIAYDMNFQRPNTADCARAQTRERYVRGSLHRMLVYEDVATGSFLLFSALADERKIRVPPHEEDRFWRRMFPCTQIFADEELSYDRYWNYFVLARERDDPPLKMKDWSVESRLKIATDYFKRAESTMTRNYVVNESLTKAIKSNLIAINMLLSKLDTGKKIRIENSHGLYPTVSIK